VITKRLVQAKDNYLEGIKELVPVSYCEKDYEDLKWHFDRFFEELEWQNERRRTGKK